MQGIRNPPWRRLRRTFGARNFQRHRVPSYSSYLGRKEYTLESSMDRELFRCLFQVQRDDQVLAELCHRPAYRAVHEGPGWRWLKSWRARAAFLNIPSMPKPWNPKAGPLSLAYI